jgi:hypothetical protein
MPTTTFLAYLINRDRDNCLNSARGFVSSIGPLRNQFDYYYESSDDFGGRPAAYLDIFPTGPDLAKDHKKFGGIFVRVWVFGEPRVVTSGFFLGAERAEQSEPRRGVAFTRGRLGKALADFERMEGFGYHTWSSGNFQWATKSSRAVARQLEQFLSFREDASITGQEAAIIVEKIGKAVRFLDTNLHLLKPITEFGRTIIQEYYSENLPELPRPNDGIMDLTGIVGAFAEDLRSKDVMVRANEVIIKRTVSCLLSKRFLIAAGLAGSGKTKMAQALARWISPPVEGSSQPAYAIIPVGADWTGSENVLGYPSGLDSGSYLAKPALDLILQAQAHPGIPHFLILDEMNLSHVERYFADILSAIESEEDIPLHGEEERKAGGRVIPQKLGLPKNLFIVGTVNVDETTYMFSPKVLDRANVIEFRMDEGELKAFLGNPAKPDLARLDGKGAGFCKAFADAAGGPADVPEEAREPFEREMELFFKALQGHGAEFGYRVAHEAARFAHFYKALGNRPGEEDWFPAAFDCIIVQKFLPKLHGSRAKLGPLLKKLWFLCLNEAAALGADALKAAEEAARSTDRKAEPTTDPDILAGARYPLSAEKIGRMWRLLNENGFASFAEA